MSDGEKDRETGFKITDRRLFTPEGEPRGDIEAPDPSEEKASEPPREATPPPPPPPEPASPRPSDPHPFTAAPGGPTGRDPMAPPGATPAGDPFGGPGPEGADAPDAAEIGFSNFLLSLATTAMVGLGEMPDPGSGLVAQNTESARQMIDILGILKEKTQGNLNPEEARLLEGLLYELRMKWVAMQQGGGAGPGPAPGAPPTDTP